MSAGSTVGFRGGRSSLAITASFVNLVIELRLVEFDARLVLGLGARTEMMVLSAVPAFRSHLLRLEFRLLVNHRKLKIQIRMSTS